MKEFNKVDLGSVKIHKKVIAEIAYHAIEGLDGIHPGRSCFPGVLAGFCCIPSYYPGISVGIDDNNQVIVDVKINVRHGLNIPQAAKKTQDHIRQAIEHAMDIDLKDVNVNIQGIERGES